VPTPSVPVFVQPTAAPSGKPVVTKSPTDETVAVNGKCQFVARYENAIYAEWHFVSPDGLRDLVYTAAEREFPTMKIINGYAKDMTLESIPAALNGWKVYCRFSNNSGFTDTQRARITVTGNAVEGAPKVTKSPTGETVTAGGSAIFVARSEGALWAVWHFVSPDGTRDLVYTDASAQFAGLQITGGDQGTLRLNNIPASLNGWRVYCVYSNSIGTATTAQAVITVQQNSIPGSAGAGGPYATGGSLTVYTSTGAAVTLMQQNDGTWKTPGGVLYYLGTDGVLRARGMEDLYTYNPRG
jgi:hypothetical protein